MFNDTVEGPRAPAVDPSMEEEEEVVVDLFVFNDTVEGPRAPAVIQV